MTHTAPDSLTESTAAPAWRRLPIGAEPAPGGGVHFRVWAPSRHSVHVTWTNDTHGATEATALAREPDGYFSGVVADARVGTRYRYQLDEGDAYPDPASRWQPEGPHGPSVVVDPSTFAWSDARWLGPTTTTPVFYELHVGTFTREGTWHAALHHLPALAELGISHIELMPVSEFDGRHGWGYDGVDLFAPYHFYGTPDDMRRFVDRAHSLGIAVVLDVVYNHLGPVGNYLRQFTDRYFSEKYRTDWGEAIDFEGERAAPVREFVLSNARYWIDEMHLDGLRIDATQNMYDASPRHILADVSAAAREAARGRNTYLVAENEPQEARCIRSAEDNGHGLDAVWNDDWHHSAMVALSRRDEAYYADYYGNAAEFVAAAKFGFLYQGQWYAWQKQRRGTPTLTQPPHRFVHFLQNHDQVANSFRGDRLHRIAGPARVRAFTALLLLGPQTPMLFQGQEFGASSPFLYFADHDAELMRLVREGRSRFLAQFETIATPLASACLSDPADEETFLRSKIDHAEREKNHEVWALHRDLIRLRRSDPVIAHAAELPSVDGAVLRDDAFVLRYFGRNEHEGNDRLLLVNLGGPLRFTRMPEPLMAPSERGLWSMRWSSEAPEYGGLCTPAFPGSMRDWYIPGNCAVLLASDESALDERGEDDRR